MRTPTRRTVIVGGSGTPTHTQKLGWTKIKGYAKSRRAYDARRRLSQWTQHTTIFVRILRKDPCCFCGTRPIDVDHIIPLLSGGRDQWENMTAACAGCNRGRRDLDILRFMLRRAT